MKKSFLSTLAVLLTVCSLFAQETTLRIANYNLLRYGASNRFCDTDCKDQNLKVILEEIKPDLMGFNEIIDGGSNADIFTDRLLQRVFNVDGVTAWKKSPMVTNQPGEPITNVLMYNSNKVEVVSMTQVPQTRAAIYKCYFKANDLAATKDTLFFYVTTVHLKAGSTDNDLAERAREAKAIVNEFKKKNNLRNVFIMGDFNARTASEECMVTLANVENGIYQMKDPLNRMGNWNGNDKFKDIHTQSTRTTQESDGGSNGGSDDRLDIIFVNDDVMNNKAGVRYAEGSYKAVGQDGTFFNKSVMEATTISSTLKSALYRTSDHLPVRADFIFKGVPAGLQENLTTRYAMGVIENPVNEQIRLRFSVSQLTHCSYQLYNLFGQKAQQGSFSADAGTDEANIRLDAIPAGVYVLSVQSGGLSSSFRIVVE
jgi:endonuclease/exonuclease/phosphatase family metal-dependent hydrolase